MKEAAGLTAQGGGCPGRGTAQDKEVGMSANVRVIVYGMTATAGGMEISFMNYYRRLNHESVRFTFVTLFEHIAFEEELLENGERILTVPRRAVNYRENRARMTQAFRARPGYDIAYMMALDLSNIDFLKCAKRLFRHSAH